MDNSQKNTINGVQETISKRIAEVAKPEKIPGLSKLQQDCFTAMANEPDGEKRLELAEKMQREMAAESSVNVNAKL